MQYEFLFQPCRYDGTKVEAQNPFTGKPWLVPTNEPLTAAELNAVHAVLDKVAAQGPDEFGCYVAVLDDGCEINVYANDLDRGCMVTFRWLPASLFRFAVDLLKAGNWTMLPAIESTVAVVSSLESVKGIPDGFPPIVICDSPEELRILVTEGVDAWEKHRDIVGGDQVFRHTQNPPPAGSTSGPRIE